MTKMRIEVIALPETFPRQALDVAATYNNARKCAGYLRGRFRKDYRVLDSGPVVTIKSGDQVVAKLTEANEG